MSIVSGPEEGSVLSLDHARITIGRARQEGSRAEAWILLFDKSVSREHAELVWKDESKSYHLRHLSKTNLTRVDDESLTGETLLRAGQVVRVGNSELVFELAAKQGSSGEATEAPPVAASSELTERLQVGHLGLSLQDEDRPELVVLEGPDSGLTVGLTGFRISLGGPESVLADGDQLVEIGDKEVLANCLSLKWDGLEGRFAVKASLSLSVFRKADGISWQGELPKVGAYLRVGDQVKMGQTLFEIRTPGSDTAPKAARSVALPD